MTHILCNDALGRLTSVIEMGLNGATTNYAHDALDDLLAVSQGGGVQSRSFRYDSLKRLASATNPESGNTTFTYDAAGNVLTKQDGRGITTCYGNWTGSSCNSSTGYDALNRVLLKTYSDGTPAASFGYDEPSVSLGGWTSPSLGNPKGHLTHTATISGGTLLAATVEDYDPMGRPKDHWQCTPVNCGSGSMWTTSHNYNGAGDLISWSHPAGFTISQPVDGARHVMQVTSSVSGAAYPATLAMGTCGTLGSSICYAPWGAVSQLQNGCAPSGSCTNAQETYSYNNRLQMVMAQLAWGSNPAQNSCRVYNYYTNITNPSSCSLPSQGTDNNGTVAGMYYSDSAGLTHTASYHYDGVNRLTSASATGNVAYSQAFSYDVYGNLSCTPSGPGCVALTYNTATNRITTSGYSYDAAGNLTGDGTYIYNWDAESRLTAVYQSGSVVSMNTYNALGQRVEDVTGASTTDEAYGAGGNLLLRYTGDSNSRSFVPFNGSLLAEYYCGGMIFDHPDALGSATTATDCTGNVVNEKLYYPFGEFWTGSAIPNLGVHQEFAQLPDYDPETDQYNTANRHYSPMGRWLSPDLGNAGADPSNPQTWNMYAYAGNNPTTNVDPDGEDYYLMGGQACNDDPSRCDKQGYLLDENGNRQVITDQQIQNGDVPYTLGANGVATINGFQAQFFDNTPTSIDVTGTPGSAAAAVGANALIGMYNSVAGDPWATGLTQFIMGRDYIPMPHLSGGEGYAAYSGLALAMLVPAVAGDDEPTPGQVAQAEQVLLTKGRGAVMKGIRTFEKLIAEHEEKIRNASGYTSSMEKEVRNFRQLIRAYQQVLGR